MAANHHVIKTFWPILKILQLFGMFPIKKSSLTPYGFKAMSHKEYFIKMISVFLLRKSLTVSLYSYIMLNYDTSIWEIYQAFFGMSVSFTDNSAFIGCTVVTILSTLSILIGNFSLKNDFTMLLKIFHGQSLKPVKQVVNSKALLLFLMIFWFVMNFFSIFLFTLTLIKNAEVHLLILVLCIIDFSINCFTVYGPTVGFLIMYCEVCQQLNYWISSLIQKIQSMEENFDSGITNECLQLYLEGLKKSNQAFSRMILWITGALLINLICSSFLAMSLLFDGISIISILLLTSSLLFYGVFYFLNYLSQEVTDNVSKLKETISISSVIPYEEKFKVIENINTFNGFDGCGYFTLGKPHLTAILSNFTTFIIVLIQFRMAEK